MPAPQETLWDAPPHTLAKHEILRRYLGAWFPILGSHYSRIVYIDGFCGPGQYRGGEPGSPIVALDEAFKHRQRLSANELVFLFIDKRPDRIAHLQGELANRSYPANFIIEATAGEFEVELAQILDHLDAQHLRMAPAFAFTDPFGFAGLPLCLVRRLLEHRKTDVLVNIMTVDINRFLEHQDPQVRNRIVDLCGTPSVLRVAQTAVDRIVALRQLYQQQLSTCAKFVRSFEMRDCYHRTIYHLFFASNHPLGHARIKEAFWKVDPTGSFCSSDATNPNQPVLFEVDETPKLAAQIANNFAGQTATAHEVRAYVEDATAFLAAHGLSALRQLEVAGTVTVDPLKQNGARRRRGTFPDGAILRFN